MDRIYLTGISAFAFHGVYQEERRTGQRFSVDLIAEVDLYPAGVSDNLQDSVDYGLNKEKLVQMLDLYKQQYGHNIYLTNAQGSVIAHNTDSTVNGLMNLTDSPQLQSIFQKVSPKQNGSYEYNNNGETFLLNSTYLTNLDSYLFVDTSENQATAKIRETFYINIFICIFACIL